MAKRVQWTSYLLQISAPLTDTKCTENSFAKALTSMDLPPPEGPYNNMPPGLLRPVEDQNNDKKVS